MPLILTERPPDEPPRAENRRKFSRARFRGAAPRILAKILMGAQPDDRYNAIMKAALLNRITIEPGKCGGKPCIRGLRIRVSDILDLLAAEATEDEILRDYPLLERDDIRAALARAKRGTASN